MKPKHAKEPEMKPAEHKPKHDHKEVKKESKPVPEAKQPIVKEEVVKAVKEEKKDAKIK